MGYDKRGSIVTYWPDNTPTEFYSATYGGIFIHDVLKEAAEHFKCSTYELMTEGSIESEYIHTDCLYYDSFDSSDWTNFIKITYKRK